MTETQKKALVLTLVFATGGAIGRFTVPTKTVTVKQVVEVEKKVKVSNTDTNRNKHTETTVTEEVKPDGTKHTTTKKVEDTNTDRRTERNTASENTMVEHNKTEVTKDSGKVNISALAGFSITRPELTYGAHLSAPVIGPITIGAFGFANGTMGASLGLSF